MMPYYDPAPLTAADLFIALDPILLSEMTGERTTISVNTKALHDLMTAYQIRRIAEGAFDMGSDLTTDKATDLILTARGDTMTAHYQDDAVPALTVASIRRGTVHTDPPEPGQESYGCGCDHSRDGVWWLCPYHLGHMDACDEWRPRMVQVAGPQGWRGDATDRSIDHALLREIAEQIARQIEQIARQIVEELEREERLSHERLRGPYADGRGDGLAYAVDIVRRIGGLDGC